MNDRRSFLGAVAALVAAPFVAKAVPVQPYGTPGLGCSILMSPELLEAQDIHNDAISAAARLRALRRFA